jgi:aldehyde dehydrogenase (NAD+)
MNSIIHAQRQYFATDVTKPYAFRYAQLAKLKQAIEKFEPQILEALKKDLNKSEFEAYTTEVGFTLMSIKKALKNLKQWMKIKKVSGELFLFMSQSFVMPEPKGNVLLIGPYNYPFQLVIEPLIGVIAAGNTAIIKPSEFTKHTEKVIVDMFRETFAPEYIAVVTGDASVNQALLAEKFDHIFFTGSTRVGQIVYEAAAKHLTPVTLELGGKSPTIIDETANLEVAAKRIAFAKFTNAGQTCIAPDYVYIHETIKDAFLEQLKKVISSLYADQTSFGKIVSDRHYSRLQALLKEGTVWTVNPSEASTRYLSPTLVSDVSWKSPVMNEEIFGPILPFMTFRDLDDVIQLLKTKEKPLALYLFSESKTNQTKVWQSLSFGNGAINDALMQVANSSLPFGGVGSSGMGSYHGYESFKTFSHFKSYIKKATWIDLPVAYPPHTKAKFNLIKKIMK